MPSKDEYNRNTYNRLKHRKNLSSMTGRPRPMIPGESEEDYESKMVDLYKSELDERKAKWFLDNWTSKRKDILASNYYRPAITLSFSDFFKNDKELGDELAEGQRKARWGYSSYDYYNNMNVRDMPMAYKESFGGKGNTKSDTEIVADKRYAFGITKPSDNLIFYPKNPKMGTRVHENSHASSNAKVDAQEGAIGRKKKEYNNSYLNSNIEYDSYKDDSSEIYARLNAFRYNNNIDPTKVYTKEDVENMRKSADIKDDSLLNRYNDDFILFLLNDVAENSSTDKENDSFYAADGGVVKKDPRVEKANQSKADFIARLKQEDRGYIKDWSSDGISTHKMRAELDDEGNPIVFPDVQMIDGKLYDFTDPKYQHDPFDSMRSAISRGDTVRFDTLDDAIWFSENYKNYYPKFNEYKDGGTTPPSSDWTSEDIGNPVYSKTSFNSADQKRRDERFKKELQQQKDDNFRNVVAPIVGDVKSGFDAIDEAQQGQYVNATLAALGILPFIPGLHKTRKLFSKQGDRVVKTLSDKGDTLLGDLANTVMFPKRLLNMIEWYSKEGGSTQKRKLSEMFPIMAADVDKADQIAGDAVARGVNWVEDYYKERGPITKINKIVNDNGYHMPPERIKPLMKEGVIDAEGNVDINKYLDMYPVEVGGINGFDPVASGYHLPIEHGGKTVVYDRGLIYRRNPKNIESTAVHEQNHAYQGVMGIDDMDVYDKTNKYWKANPDHTIGKLFSEVATKNPKEPWFESAQGLHSVLMQYKHAKKIDPSAEITDKMMDNMFKFDQIRNFFDITEENRPKIKKLLNALPAMAPAMALSYIGNDNKEYRDGGKVGDADYDIAYDYLVNKRNIKPVQAVAIMSNLDRESGLNPDIENSIGAYGIQQWLGPRKENLFKRYGKSPSLLQQLEYLVDEHEGKVKGSGWNFINKGKNLGSDRFNYYMYSKSDFDNAETVADAIIAWNQGFGRPATHELNNEGRLKAGSILAQRYGLDLGEQLYSKPLEEQEVKEVVEQKPVEEEKSNGVASYVPKETKAIVSYANNTEEEPVESAAARRLREKQTAINKKNEEDKRKMEFFNMVWNGISLRKKNKS